MKRRAAALLVLALSTLILTAASTPWECDAAPASLPVRIGYAALRINIPVFVAQERGIFKKHGLDVTLERFDTAQPCIDALCANRIQVGGFAALPISYAAQMRSGVPFLYSAMILEDTTRPFSYLIVRKSSDIRSIADLAGKRVGILPTIAYKVWLERILEKVGVKDVVIQNVAPAMQAHVLASGNVDALWTNDPMATTILQQGVGRKVVDEALCAKYIRNPFPLGAFNMRRDYARANPEVARRLMASVDEAIRWTMSNQQAAKRCMAPYVTPEQRMFVEKYADACYLTSAQAKEQEFKYMSNLYSQLGLLQQPLDLTGLYYRP